MISIACPVGGLFATLGQPYSHSAVVSGSVPPNNFTIVLGSLPPGLTLNASTGLISGTPTSLGSYPYTIQVIDSLSHAAQAGCLISTIQLERPMSLLTAKQWAAIQDPGTTGQLQTDVYVDNNHPNMGLHFWPVPASSPGITIQYWKKLTQFISLMQQIEFPPGYYDALVYNLALQLAVIYKKTPSQIIVFMAQNSKKTMQDSNAQILSGAHTYSRTLHDANIGEIEPPALPTAASPSGGSQ